MRRLLIALIATWLLLPFAPASAQPYPSKPIKIIVPFGPGTITDTLTRIIAQELSLAVGQPVVVVNKGGADGAIGAVEAMRSPPDGYTLVVAPNSSIAVVPLIRKQPPYNPLTDFTPITFIGNTTFFIVVHPSVPAKSIAELIAYAKANPKKISYGSGNTTGIVSTGLLAANAGIEMVHIPYKSEPEAIPDLLSGQIQLMIAAYTTVAPHVKDGKLRALATALPERSPLMPDVPSIVESGQPKFPIGPWAAVLGPANLPADIVARLNKELVTILNRADIKEKMLKFGFAPKSSTPEEFTSYLKEQLVTWKKALQDAGIEAQ